MLPFSQFCLAMKVAAVGPVSQEDATAALQRYKRLEDGAPSMRQVGRYAGIGAVAAPVAAGLKDVIRGGKGADWKGRTGARNVIGTAVAGALTSGGIPLVRAHLDREAEKNTLRKYVAQGVAPKIASVPAASGVARVKEIFTGSRAKSLRDQAGVATGRADQHFRDATRGHTRFMDYHLASETKHRDAATRLNIEANVERAKQVGAIGGTAAAATGAVIGAKKLLGKKDAEKEKTSAMSGVTPAKPWAAGEYADMGKMGAGAPTRGGFLMASEVAPWRQPKLHTAIQHEPQQIVEKMGAARAEWLQKRAGATTPAGRLASSHRVGLPKVSAPPGPSIADTVPTFGQRLPGANKTTIGKRSIREVPTLASTAPTQG